jgi:hypothetical protein
LIAGFVLATGWFKARLNRRPLTYPNAFSDEVLFFFLAQVVLIPLLMMLILFCACLIDPQVFSPSIGFLTGSFNQTSFP